MKTLVLTLIVLLLSSPVYGATRIYLPSTGTNAVSPAFGGWGDTTTGAPDRIRCVTKKIGTTMIGESFTSGGGGPGNTTYLNRQYVSDPIAAQTISGTVKGQVRGTDNTATVYSAILIRVVSNDGSTVRGTLLALTAGANDYPAALTNRYTPASTALAAVTAQNGDRIVIEIGISKTAGGAKVISQSFGDDSATDLPENETETLAYNPWIEFSQNIIFPSVMLIE